MTAERVDTGSALPLTGKCEGPAALPRYGNSSDKADVGTALHAHMQLRAEVGIEEALRRIPETADACQLDESQASIFAARARSFKFVPPEGALAEWALCMLGDGSVQRTTGGRGHYPDLPPGAITAGQIDLMWSEPEPLDMTDPERPRCPKGSTLWVLDWKGGSETWVEPVDRNLQVDDYVVMATKLTGAERAMPAIVFIRKGDGEWECPPKAWDREELVDAELRVVAQLTKNRHARLKVLNGEPLALNEGSWCTYCPSRQSCPAKVAMIKAVVAGADVVPDKGMPLEKHEAQWLASRLGQIESFAEQGRKMLKEYVDRYGPIDLDHGLAWGPVQVIKDVVDPVIGAAALAEEVGLELARKAVKVSLTKSSMELAVAEHMDGARGKAAVMRRVMTRAIANGGVQKVPATEYRTHRAKAEENEDETEAAQ